MSITPTHQLNPSTPPFLFPRPSASPTFTSDSHTTASSTAVESTSHLSDTPKASARKDKKPSHINSLFPADTARAFGAGWKSSSTTSLASQLNLDAVPLLESPHILGRPRSPSVPNLPSHLQARHRGGLDISFPPHSYRADTSPYHLPSGLVNPPAPSAQSQASSCILTPLSPAYSNIDQHHYPSFSSTNSEYDADRTLNASLLHHQSVPNLPQLRPALSKKASGYSVRFEEYEGQDEKEAFEEESWRRGSYHQRVLRRMPAFHFGSMDPTDHTRLLSPRSMPVMQMVGEGRNVYIHRVSSRLDEGELREYAAHFGEVVSIKIPLHTAKPHAFVMFKKPEQAQRFIAHLQIKNVECEYGKEDYQVQNKALEDPNSANLYISGLPVNITFEDLATLLAPGRICSWKPLVDEMGNRRGPIMARLQARPQADEAIRRLNGAQYSGMSEKLQIRIADSEEQKHFKRQQALMRDHTGSAPSADHSHRRASMPSGLKLPTQGEDLSHLVQTREALVNRLSDLDQRLSKATFSPQSPPLSPRSPVMPQSHNPVLFPTESCFPPMEYAPRAHWQNHGYTSSDGSGDAVYDWDEAPSREKLNSRCIWPEHNYAPRPPIIRQDPHIFQPVPMPVHTRHFSHTSAPSNGLSFQNNETSIWSTRDWESVSGANSLHHAQSSPQLRTKLDAAFDNI